MAIRTFQCNNCGRLCWKPLPGDGIVCECGMHHMFAPKEVQEPVREVSGEDWRSILDKEQEVLSPMTEDGLITILRNMFPHGHPRFIELCIKMMELHSKKNYDYAYGGNELGNFNRVSAIKKLYPGIDWTTPAATALDYMLKQQDAVMWSWSQGYEGQVEDKGKRIEDIYIYWPIIRILLEEA